MEARRFRPLVVVAALVVFAGATYPTPNFIVQTADPQLAEQIGKAAEKYRRELAVLWLGHAMPDWSHPCPMTVHVGPHLGAGGATTFLFDRGEVYGWRMNIQGSAERVLDSVLPHEITHMVFASHFRCPVPRWADEGGATSVEHGSELARHHRMLTQFLRSGRGIAFSQMFAMTDYPADVMPLYAQGFALAEYLIMQGGRRKYVEYLGEALQTRNWSAATMHHYGFRDLGVLQNTWLAWVAQGFPAQPPKNPEAKPPVQLASADRRLPRPQANLIYHVNGRAQDSLAAGRSARVTASALVPVARPCCAVRPGRKYPATAPCAVVSAPAATSSGAVTTAAATSTPVVASTSVAASTSPAPTTGFQSSSPATSTSGWYPAGTRPFTVAATASPTSAAVVAQTEPVRAEVTRPQPIERPRQMILE